ncbi:MAG: hypothetical protein AUK55_04675 [Syntrophobacteraceae bacterium CG2_30_61_12]|nr:MAG: hypothetical protein AUK55_04675 [Syntrophobacteraceae bacterium CG2_30_61_12]
MLAGQTLTEATIEEVETCFDFPPPGSVHEFQSPFSHLENLTYAHIDVVGTSHPLHQARQPAVIDRLAQSHRDGRLPPDRHATTVEAVAVGKTPYHLARRLVATDSHQARRL